MKAESEFKTQGEKIGIIFNNYISQNSILIQFSKIKHNFTSFTIDNWQLLEKNDKYFLNTISAEKRISGVVLKVKTE